MICIRCSSENRPEARYCAACGLKFDHRTEYRPPPAEPVIGSQVASRRSAVAVVLGLSSIVLFCGPLTGILAIVAAYRELNDIRNGRASPAGRLPAKLGLWTGLAGSVFWVLFWIWKLRDQTPVSDGLIIT